MKRLDRMIVNELKGPWTFGMALFTALIFAGTYLFRVTEFFVSGVNPLQVAEVSMLLIPGIMAKTFPMAVLLSTLLAFGRLSSDSEIVALRAAGVSIARIMVPVAFFSMAVAIGAFVLNEFVVPGASARGIAIQSDIAARAKVSSFRSLSQLVVEDGEIKAVIFARDFSQTTQTLRDATIGFLNEKGDVSILLRAKELSWENDKEWRVRGGGTLKEVGGGWESTIKGDIWPPQVPKITISPEELVINQMKDLDQLSMRQMREQINKARQNPNVKPQQVVNLEYGYWNKIALPLAALVYGLLGAPLGIRSHRTGAASGFALSIAIIFLYLLIANFMNVWAMGGLIPAYVASFTPIVIGLTAAGVILWRRNG